MATAIGLPCRNRLAAFLSSPTVLGGVGRIPFNCSCSSSSSLQPVRYLSSLATASSTMSHHNQHQHQQHQDIEELHQQALNRGSTTYVDPETGFTVFTELSHLKRGTCCGNLCRHCPYGWENVPSTHPDRIAKLHSGDLDKANQLIRSILNQGSTNSSIDPPNGHVAVRGTTKPPPTTAANGTITGNAATRKKSAATTAVGTPGTKKNVPYTRTGDSGTSQLLTGERRSKDDCNFEALGTVDELCSVVGVCHAHLLDNCEYGSLHDWLLDIMSRLFDAGSHVAKPRKRVADEDFVRDGVGGGLDAIHIDHLEQWINEMTEELPELRSFILPTGAKAAAHLHVARTVCRRAERRLVPLVAEGTCDPNVMKYVNRLSDFFFTAARWVNFCEGRDEIQYQLEQRKDTQRQRVARPLQQQQQQQHADKSSDK